MKALTAKRVLTGSNMEVMEDACILVEGDQILRILPRPEFLAEQPADCQITDLGDVTLMPGMIECHNHLALDARLPGHLDMMGESE